MYRALGGCRRWRGAVDGIGVGPAMATQSDDAAPRPTVWDRYRSPNQDHRPGFGFDGFEIRPQAAVLIRCAFRWLQNSFRTMEAAEVHVLVKQSWQLFGITRDASICSLPG